MKHFRTVFITTLLFIMAFAWPPSRAEDTVDGKHNPQRPNYTDGRALCILANKDIVESSGLACGRRNPGVLWTHNDSGDLPRIFAFNLTCEDIGSYTIQGAEAVDWEDMASYNEGGKSYLLVADVGNNLREREVSHIYVLEEPPFNGNEKSVRKTIRVLKTIRFKFEDGPHNCEAVAIDPGSEAVYLVSYNRGLECGLYELKMLKEISNEIMEAEKIASLHLPTATAMDISPDGMRAVILTYDHAYEYTRQPEETWERAFSRKPRRIIMPPRIQGESICYGPDGKTLYLTSEKLPTPLWEVPPQE